MKIKTLITALFLTSIVSLPAWGCLSAGPATHVGKVLKVDGDNGTFTILDAETVSPITFKADADIMKKVASATGTAIVDFEIDGTVLVATSVTIR